MDGRCCEDDTLRDSELVRSMLLRDGVTSPLFRPGRSSTLFRLGDPFLASRELLRRFSWVSTSGRRRRFCTCSMADAFGSEEEMLSVATLRPTVLSDVGCCCGLPPLRVLVGMGTVEALLGVVSPRAGRVTDELVLRLDNDGGVDGGRLPRRLPAPPNAKADALELRWPVIVSRMAFISTGMGTRCTRLTVGQSAACMSLFSAGLGALQQPGQPGFW